MTFDGGQSRAYAYSYEDDEDTEVVDVEEPLPVISLPVISLPVIARTGTDGALTMHVIVEGKRHRRRPDLSATACKKKYNSQFAPLFREALTHREGEMCPECFHPSEIEDADAEREREGF